MHSPTSRNKHAAAQRASYARLAAGEPLRFHRRSSAELELLQRRSDAGERLTLKERRALINLKQREKRTSETAPAAVLQSQRQSLSGAAPALQSDRLDLDGSSVANISSTSRAVVFAVPSPSARGRPGPFAASAVQPVAPCAPAAFSTKATAASMSSASKLRAVLAKKRTALSELNPNTKRQAGEEHAVIRISSSEEGENEIGKEDEQENRQQYQQEAEPEEIVTWEQAIRFRIAKALSLKAGGSKGSELTIGQAGGVRVRRMRTNVRLWGEAVQAQGHCLGPVGPGRAPLPRPQHCKYFRFPFPPDDWSGGGLIQFAHWPETPRLNDKSQLVIPRMRVDEPIAFKRFLTNGRFLCGACHQCESSFAMKGKPVVRYRATKQTG